MKKILILGGCGYIGSYLYQKLSEKYRVETIDLEWFGNFNNPNNIKMDYSSLNKNYLNHFDTIILLAANSSVKLCENFYDAFDNNVIKFVKLTQKLNHNQKFIYASSSCVYVTSDNKPKEETDNLFPMDGLTLTKTTIDQYLPLTNIEYYGLRFGSVNGWSPNMRLDLMINSMTLSALNNNVVNVFNGHAHRPILSINDLYRSVETIIETDKDLRGIYNVASFNDNILNIGKKVADYMGVKLVDKGTNFTYDFTISSEKFKNTFNFEFKDNIESIIDSIKNNEINPNWKRRDTI
jgi:UDP-glucose 4-epimerase